MTLSTIILLLFGLLSGNNEKMDNYLKENLKNYASFSYEIISQPASLDDKTEFNIDDGRAFKMSGNYGYIPIKIENGDTETNSIITVKLKLFAKTLISSTDIDRDQTLSPGMFVMEEREISNLRGDIFTDFSEITNYRTKSRIRANTLLEVQMLERLPDVSYGDPLMAYTRVGSVVVSIKVYSRSEGYIGDIIRVIDDNRKIYRGKVESKNKIRIIG
ncbi:MAG: flagellar basal body P-ring formation chaperone FlgA [Melioribacteraceae bacterium]|nr:flagellar basal body P-ring formation chaperone FlgA [Melioribacteraceae bacterium]MCF8355156.1 flagellar basal body P-ring formation chaperone FlgA [Melioribacteraceae bacterium]MCF8392485.1 flagellar basal body P-ring formation chaperone FlgA [Melioribacteraceae bacterium]MCF8418396.1 flagellar basal body P-ring formation chaperone FlgA [Melioribacteraceae bacterium]